MSEDVAPRSVSAVLDELRSGQSSFEQYLDGVLARVESCESRLQALLPEPADARRARIKAEYAALERRGEETEGASGSAGNRALPLYGALVGVKDIFRVDGLPTRAGSKLPPEVFAGPQAESVNRLRSAGALVLAKTVSTEFAYFSPGPTRNPWNPRHTPGGSSSGSAAAVAAGYVPLAIGTQTIGSITRPASFCGVVGFKPSLDRVSTAGVVPFSRSVDHVGLFAADVASAGAGAAALCDNWIPRKRRGKGRPVLGLIEDAYVEQAEDGAREAVLSAAQRLAESGYELKRVALFPNIEQINALHLDLIAREFAQLHEQWYAEYGELYSEKSRELIKKGRAVTEQRAEESRRAMGSVRAWVQQAMRQAGVSAVLSPATVGEAPEGIEATGSPIMNLPWTFFGLPTITLPCALGVQGLPLGLQMAGYFGDDERLLNVAAEVERVLAFKSRHQRAER